MEVTQLRRVQQQLQQVQGEAEALKVDIASLQEQKGELEKTINALKEGTETLKKDNQTLQETNTQLKSDITGLDVEIAHLNYLRGENEALRNAQEHRNQQNEKQLQESINARLDLMSASARLDSILEGFGDRGKTISRSSAAEPKSEPTSASVCPSPISPASLLNATASNCSPRGAESSVKRSSTKVSPDPTLSPTTRTKTPLYRSQALQNRITPAPTLADRKPTYSRRDKRRYEEYSPRDRYAYDGNSDSELSYLRSDSPRYAPRRRPEADYRR